MTGSREGRGVDKSLCRARRVHTAQSPRLDTPRAREREAVYIDIAAAAPMMTFVAA